MESIRELLNYTPILPLFVCLALGYVLARLRVGRIRLGGVPGTLFAAVAIGQIGVEVDPHIQTYAFAVFIYALAYVCGPQFFNSLGRSTLRQVHLTVFGTGLAFATAWGLARIFDLDKGTAAGLLAGSTTESASVGTATETLAHMGLDEVTMRTFQANTSVTYAITYLFGMTLVVIFVSVIAPWLMRVRLKDAVKEVEKELGDAGQNLGPGQVEVLPDLPEVVARVYLVEESAAVGTTVARFEEDREGRVFIQQVARWGIPRAITPDLELAKDDRVAIVGRRDKVVEAGALLGPESANVRGVGFVGETRDVVLTNRKLVGVTALEARSLMNPDSRRAFFATRLTRVGHEIELRLGTRLAAGDIITLFGPPDALDKATRELGYAVKQGQGVDYAYMGLGLVAGILLGMVSVPIAGAPVALHTGGGCLISGLVFGWLRSKRPVFGCLPPETALHMREFGLTIFIACVGLAAGPQAFELIREKGALLPVLALVMVLVPLVSSTFYARFVLKMNPALICGSLAGVLTCTPGLNAVVDEAGSEVPVLGYTVPYALANVILTLLGPVIVLTV